jgi:SnoaL-like domain
MKEPDITRRYHDTWNGRDADALVGCFTKDGTFCNPDTYPGIGGEELANFVKGLWTAVPDFSIELLNAGEIEPGVVAHHCWYVALTLLEQMEVNLRAAPSQFRGLPSFSLKETRFVQIKPILTGRR